MTRDQIAGFMLGISVGTAVGFFLRESGGSDEISQRVARVRDLPAQGKRAATRQETEQQGHQAEAGRQRARP